MTTEYYYQELSPITRDEANSMLASGNPDSITDALLRLTLFDQDRHWLEHLCLKYIEHSSSEVRIVAVQCLGHLARIHGELNLELVRPILEEMQKDPELTGYVGDALGDIEVYITGRRDEEAE